jgi:uncharacterized protein
MSKAAQPSTLGTAVVTGASSGIGKIYCGPPGDLLVVARRADRLQAIAADIESRFRHPG